jgi:hypothetical protein
MRTFQLVSSILVLGVIVLGAYLLGPLSGFAALILLPLFLLFVIILMRPTR